MCDDELIKKLNNDQAKKTYYFAKKFIKHGGIKAKIDNKRGAFSGIKNLNSIYYNLPALLENFGKNDSICFIYDPKDNLELFYFDYERTICNFTRDVFEIADLVSVLKKIVKGKGYSLSFKGNSMTSSIRLKCHVQEKQQYKPLAELISVMENTIKHYFNCFH